ncbi:hypothetical protein WJ35_13830 [Burkholderia ubonensis]|uniref:Uncharacterized protein n=1 Tax=Burkholderia ubonensis TaxID=101571 RepID=A0A1B4LFU3_9BURK|nr:hypothetical protein WJ35_13830 [Burkholderia ubonensis]
MPAGAGWGWLRRVGRRGGGDFLEAVAEPAHGGDSHAARLDLLAQPVHVDLDRVVADFLAPFAQVVDELLLRHEAADPLQQHFEQAELARGQVEHAVVRVRDAADLVERERAVPHDGRAAARAAPGQRAHARLEFVERERLGHVVVGAEVEALHALVDAVGGGQDQHGEVGIACAQALQDVEPGQLRQAEIEDQQVERLHRQGRVGLDAVLHVVDGIARLAE